MKKGLLLFALLGAMAFAESPSEFILKVKDGYNSRKVAQKASEMAGVQVVKVLDSYVLIKAKEDYIEALTRLPELEWVEPNRSVVHREAAKEGESFFGRGVESLKYFLSGRIPDDPFFSKQWGFTKVGMQRAWLAGIGREDVIVAIIDSGIDYNHEDLKGNVWVNRQEICGNLKDDDNNGYVDDCYGIDVFNEDGDPMDEMENPHGTGVASVIGAVGDNRRGIAGVNWKVRILTCKWLGNRGEGTTGTAMAFYECARYIKSIKDRGENVVAVNMSFGLNTTSIPEVVRDGISLLRSAGILVVASAGNQSSDNDQSPRYPCNFSMEFDNVICVANSDQKDNLHPSSNYGARSVQVVAPGTQIAVAFIKNRYGEVTGTSFAAPLVAGLAGLIKAVYPRMNYLDIKNRILGTVDKIPALEGKVATGGRINAYRALGKPHPPQKGGLEDGADDDG